MGAKLKSISHLIGKKFNFWTLLQDIGIVDGERVVKVICECGVENEVRFYALKKGKTKSCGCKIRLSEDYVGKKINKLTITELVGVLNQKTIIKATCECGKIKIYPLSSLLSGNTKSCGCNKEKIARKNFTTHNLSHHPLYSVWSGMNRRCSDPKFISYKDYGGKGVKVSLRWVDDFQAFYDWAIKRWEPGLRLDKDIKSSTGIGVLYCPELCCFVTSKINNRHKSNNRIIVYNGESMCLADWSDRLGLPQSTLGNRLKNGWSLERTFTTPKRKIANAN